MKQKIYTLKGDNRLEPVINFVRNYYQKAYESQYPGGFIRVYEDFSFLNSNEIMVCLRVDSTAAEKGIITIEMISGGGGDNPITGAIFGSESRRIKNFTSSLEEFCEEHKISLVTG